jgi:hypothetical protein
MEVFPDTRALMEAEAGRIVSVARRAIAVRNGCQLALSGGAMPRTLYERLAKPDDRDSALRHRAEREGLGLRPDRRLIRLSRCVSQPIGFRAEFA